MALLDGKQLRDQSLSLNKVSGINGLVTFTSSATMSFAAGTTLRQADENIIIGIDVVNKNYVDAVAQGLHIKEAVEVIATYSISLSGSGQVIDGFTVSVGDRVLVNGQAGNVATASNGIYLVSSGTWSRALDSDGTPQFEVAEGDFVFVSHGDVYQSTGWVLAVTNAANNSDIQVGTESQLWAQFSSAGVIEAGAGLTKTGNTLDVQVGTGLWINGSNQVAINDTTVTAGNYGTAGSVSTFTVNAQGQLTGATSVSIDINSGQINDFSTAVDTVIFNNDNFVDGETIDFTVLGATGVSAEVTLGSLTASRFDIINSASASQGWKLGYNTTGQFEWFDPSLSDISEVVAGNGLTGGGVAGAVTLDVQTINGISILNDAVALGGTLSQDTTINGNSGSYSFTVGNVDNFLVTASSSFDVSVDDGLIILDAGDGGSIDIYGGDVLIYATGSIDMTSTEQFNIDTVGLDINFTGFGTVSVGSATAGLVYSATPSNSLPLTLIHKQYVDDAVANLGSGTIAGVTAGVGLSGGGTANYIQLDVNLGVNSGLTFSGDDIIVDTNIAGNGLDFSTGVLTVNTSEITGALAGNGLTANGSALDVNVNADSLEIVGDVVRLRDTVTGDRTFQDSLTVGGNLTVNGTVSYINTENLYVEDNIITLNATFSGVPFLNSGIEVVRGNEPAAALIWNESTDLWSAGISGSEVSILLNAGTGLTKNGATVSLDFTSITGTGLTQNGSVISIDTAGFATVLAGDGLSANGGTLSVNVGNGLEIVSDNVYLGGTLSQNTTINGDNNQNSITFTSLDSFGVTSVTGSITLSGSSTSLLYVQTGDISLQTTPIGTFSLDFGGGVLTDLSGNGYGLVYSADYTGTFVTNSLITKQYVDNAVSLINADFITGVTAGNGLSGGGTSGFVTLDVNLGVNSGLTFSGDDIIVDTNIAGNGLDFTSGVLTVNTSEITSALAGNGLVDNGGALDVNVGFGLTVSGDIVQIDQNLSGQGLTFSNGVIDMVWGGTSSGTTFSNDAVAVVVDNTTIQINSSGQLTVVAGASTPVYDRANSGVTSGDDSATGVTLTATPNDYSRIQVYVNGQLQRLGNGATNLDCYISSTASTAENLVNIVSGQQLFWNGAIAGYDLATTDIIEIIYES